jgi:hypothetical protein
MLKNLEVTIIVCKFVVMKKKKILISLFDYTGNWAKPYEENGWCVYKIDIKTGTDILKWKYKRLFWKTKLFRNKYKIIVLIAIPCTDYANSGARHFKAKDLDGRTEQSQILVKKTKDVIDWLKPDIWCLENPMSRIHKLNPWLGEVKHKFNPCDYAGYDPIPDNSRYNKRTWLWGDFLIPMKKYQKPFEKDNPGWKNLGGKSERTKELRSITPLGFSYAFYSVNH